MHITTLDRKKGSLFFEDFELELGDFYKKKI